MKQRRGTILSALAVLFVASPLMVAAATAGGTDIAPRTEVDGPQHVTPIKIATGPDNSVDGYLEIGADAYGSWGGFGIVASPFEDLFNPAGGSPLEQAAFTAGFFIFVPDRSQRELLSENLDWQLVFPPDGSMTAVITADNVPSDTDGDLVFDTLTSSFDVVGVIGTDTDLSFDLVQSVMALEPGVSVMMQEYTVQNNGGLGLDFQMLRVYDGDLVWSGDFANDEVGTSMHGCGRGAYVFTQEASLPGTTAITIFDDTMGGGDYYGLKHGVQPEGGPPPYGFGTDTQAWDNFGIPDSWRSHIAGVGYDTNGVSGIAPPGSTPPEDAAVGLNFTFSLAPGASETLTVFHVFGDNQPPGGCGCTLSLSIGGTCPGSIDVSVSGATPEGSVFFAGSESAGTSTIPAGPCAGTPLDLENPRLLTVGTADGGGNINLAPNVSPGACGLLVQTVDGETCCTSNVATVP